MNMWKAKSKTQKNVSEMISSFQRQKQQKRINTKNTGEKNNKKNSYRPLGEVVKPPTQRKRIRLTSDFLAGTFIRKQ